MFDDVPPDGGKRNLRSIDRHGISLCPRRSPETNGEFIRNISLALKARTGVYIRLIGGLKKVPTLSAFLRLSSSVAPSP
jgi:hypothetical protein